MTLLSLPAQLTDPTNPIVSKLVLHQPVPDVFYIWLAVMAVASIAIIGRAWPLELGMIYDHVSQDYKNTQQMRYQTLVGGFLCGFCGLFTPSVAYGPVNCFYSIVALYQAWSFAGIIAWLVVAINVLTIVSSPILLIWFRRHPAPSELSN